MSINPGTIFIISAPSGTGKSTIINRLVKNLAKIIFSISFTTRSPRPGEIDGKDYFFISNNTFDQMINNDDFLEWVEIYKHRYGTSKNWLYEKIISGIDVLLDIDTHGAYTINKKASNVIKILLIPPSQSELRRRLSKRGNDTQQQLTIRMNDAKCQLLQFQQYDYLVVNNDIDETYKQIESIVIATRCCKQHMKKTIQEIIANF